MSMLLMVKAMNCKIGNSARKLVLIKLADNANDDGVCFPSYQHIADQCEMSRRSAISHIDALIEMGLVEKKTRKTQEGNTSNLYVLHLEQGSEKSALPPSENGDKVVKDLHHPSENISPTPSENISPTPSENFSPRTSHSLEPVIEPIKKTTQKNPDLALLAEFGIEGDLAQDFIKHRKALKVAITKTSLKGFEREAAKAQMPITQAIAYAIERGWRGFYANWYFRELAKSQSNSTAYASSSPPLRMNDPGCMAGQIVNIGGELWEL